MKYLTIVLLSVLFFSLSIPASAQQTVPSPTTVIDVNANSETSGTSSAKAQKVEYELAYPGMLPDNPLYFIKMIRDGIVKFLINDPLKKAQFNLLNAEKRMYAGRLLVEKGKDKLAIETISKSNNYLHEALASITEVRKKEPQNPDIMPFLENAKTVTLKHQEIFENTSIQLDKEYASGVKREMERLLKLQKIIDEMKEPQK